MASFFSASLQPSAVVSAVLWVAVVSFSASLVVVVILFTSRIVRSHYHWRERSLRFQYQKILNKIVVHETFSEKGAPNAAFEFYMAELRLVAGNSDFSRQLLLAQIMELMKSVTGKSAAALSKTYYAMQLYRESFRKLRSWRWQKKALAIRELAQMRHFASAPRVAKFLYSKNKLLRQESFMAMVVLEARPLSFLRHYKGEISLWMRVNIYRYLQHVDHHRLPVFSEYFNHPNVSVRLFSMSMARRFKQTASLPGLVDMLYSDNARLVGLAISAVEEMEAFAYRGHIAKLALHVWRFEKLCRRVIRCLAAIGDTETDVALVGKFLDHPCYTVRFEAVAALKKLGAHGERMLREHRAHDQVALEGILRHLSEPLLT